MRVVGHAKLVTTDTNGSSAIVTRQILVALGINLSNLSLFSAFYRLIKCYKVIEVLYNKKLGTPN